MDNNLVGLAFEDLSLEEMQASQGFTGAEGRSGAFCVAKSVITTIKCGVLATAAISGAAVTHLVSLTTRP